MKLLSTILIITAVTLLLTGLVYASLIIKDSNVEETELKETMEIYKISPTTISLVNGKYVESGGERTLIRYEE